LLFIVNWDDDREIAPAFPMYLLTFPPPPLLLIAAVPALLLIAPLPAMLLGSRWFFDLGWRALRLWGGWRRSWRR